MKTVTVQIYGESYTVKAGDNPDYVREVAGYVDGKMREIASSGKVVMTSKIAILVALNIADEFFKARRSWEQTGTEQSRRVEKMLHDIRAAVHGPDP